VLSAVPIEKRIEGGEITVASGDPVEAVEVLNVFDRYDPERAVVVPPGTLVQGHM
jgi:hypothetical protein